jgi:hypothetical protein
MEELYARFYELHDSSGDFAASDASLFSSSRKLKTYAVDIEIKPGGSFENTNKASYPIALTRIEKVLSLLVKEFNKLTVLSKTRSRYNVTDVTSAINYKWRDDEDFPVAIFPEKSRDSVFIFPLDSTNPTKTGEPFTATCKLDTQTKRFELTEVKMHLTHAELFGWNVIYSSVVERAFLKIFDETIETAMFKVAERNKGKLDESALFKELRTQFENHPRYKK